MYTYINLTSIRYKQKLFKSRRVQTLIINVHAISYVSLRLENGIFQRNRFGNY